MWCNVSRAGHSFVGITRCKRLFWHTSGFAPIECRKAQDAHGLVAEMFKFGDEDLSKCLSQIFNSMLHSGDFEHPHGKKPCSWCCQKLEIAHRRTTGDPSLYWIPRTRYLQKPLYGRLPATLEMEQSCHQTAVRPHTGIEDAFVVF